MPPRLAVLAILLFWAASTGWLFYREILPQWLVGRDDPPSYKLDPLDEIGANTTNWRVYLDGKEAGNGLTIVRHLEDRTFLFENSLTFFAEQKLLRLIGKITSRDHVGTDGKPLDMSFEVTAGPIDKQLRPVLDWFLLIVFGITDSKRDKEEQIKFGIRGTVENGELRPRFIWNGDEKSGKDLSPIPVSNNNMVFNPVQMGGKIADLEAGKSWRIPMVSPLSRIQAVLAKVSKESVEWSGKENPCFRIDYEPASESPGMSFKASTWYRQKDSLVLKQAISMKAMNLDLQLIRVDEK